MLLEIIFLKKDLLILGLAAFFVKCLLHFFQMSDIGKSSIFTGEEELFAFSRTVSRLTEMMTEEYWNFQLKKDSKSVLQ